METYWKEKRTDLNLVPNFIFRGIQQYYELNTNYLYDHHKLWSYINKKSKGCLFVSKLYFQNSLFFTTPLNKTGAIQFTRIINFHEKYKIFGVLHQNSIIEGSVFYMEYGFKVKGYFKFIYSGSNIKGYEIHWIKGIVTKIEENRKDFLIPLPEKVHQNWVNSGKTGLKLKEKQNAIDMLHQDFFIKFNSNEDGINILEIKATFMTGVIVDLIQNKEGYFTGTLIDKTTGDYIQSKHFANGNKYFPDKQNG